MIITSLKAVNVLKYKKLDLTDLPENGVIAISGANESGKSSIGETVCYALFGRTWSLDNADIGKLICWGERQCSAKITFKTNDNQHYEVARFMDNDGNIGARMNLVDNVSHPLARGPEAVTKLVHQLLGYDANEFLETFYLAQREITTPHPNSFVVKTMAGITPLEKAQTDFHQQIKEREEHILKAQEKMVALSSDIDHLAIDKQYLGTLTVQHQGALVSEEEGAEHQELLKMRLSDYHDNYNEVEALKTKKEILNTGAWFSLILGLIFLLMWFARATPVQSEFLTPIYDYSTHLWQSLANKSDFWQQFQTAWLLYLSIGCAILFLIFKVPYLFVKEEIQHLIKDVKHFANALKDTLTSIPSPENILALNKPNEKPLDPVALDYAETIEEDDLELEETEDVDLERIIAAEIQRVKKLEILPTEATYLTEKMTDWLQKRIDLHHENKLQLEQAIKIEEKRLAQYKRLQELVFGLNNIIAKRQEEIKTRTFAISLLEKAVAHLSHDFNRDIRDKVSKILPKFTEGRYEHLQIEKDSSVTAFSTEKRDFIGLDEISSGTSRQIMLSLRLALAQSLVDRIDSGLQFLFLDEPFAFFDAERTRLTLKILPDLEGDLNQIWIISQEFSETNQTLLARHILCSRELTKIEI